MERLFALEVVDRVEQGPSVIRQIREEVVERDLDIPVRVAIEELLDREKYVLSPTQREIFEQSVDRLEEHKAAVRAARQSYEADLEGSLEKVSHCLGCKAEEITGVAFRSISTAIELTDAAFEKLWQETCVQNGVDASKLATPRGIASPRWKIEIGGYPLLLSIARQSENLQAIASHEDIHVQNRYLNSSYYQDGSEEITQNEVKMWVKRAVSAVKDSDERTFREVIREATHAQLGIYINELSASTLDDPEGAYEDAFSDPTHLYYASFLNQINKLRSKLPNKIDKRLPWERIIFEEVRRAKGMALYINRTYENIRAVDTPTEELIAIIEFLTPETGYLIQAFSREAISDKRQAIRQWSQAKRKYREGWRPQAGRPETIFWSDFLLFAAGISEEKYSSLHAGVPHVFQPVRTESGLEEVEDIEIVGVERLIEILKGITKERVRRIRKLLDDASLQPLLPGRIDVKKVILETLLKGIDFDIEFAKSIDHLFTLQPKTGAETTVEAKKDQIHKMSMGLNDAAEEIVEEIMSDRDPNYDKVFTPGFSRPEGKVLRVVRLATQNEEDREGSLLENHIANRVGFILRLFMIPAGDVKWRFYRITAPCIRILSESGDEIEERYFEHTRNLLRHMSRLEFTEDLLPLQFRWWLEREVVRSNPD